MHNRSMGFHRYVAIGDSFTASGLDLAREHPGCKRSPSNYPHLVADARPDIALLDVSCGGASTAETLEPQQFQDIVNPPQFTELSERTDLVTVSLGGNDEDVYYHFLYKCVQLRAEDPDGDPCRTANGGRIERAMPQIRGRLAEVLEEVGELAPNARVVMVGYPRILPDRGDCPRRVPVAEGDAGYVRDMMALLVEAQHGAAEDAGAEYVDVWSASEGHDMCSADPWVNDWTDGPDGAHEFHPTPAHQRAVADMILEIL